MALGLSWTYIQGQYPDPEFERLAKANEQAAYHNYRLFNYRARQVILDTLKTDVSRGYSGNLFSPLGSSAVVPIATLLTSQGAHIPGGRLGRLRGAGRAVAERHRDPVRAAAGHGDRGHGERALPGPGAHQEEEVAQFVARRLGGHRQGLDAVPQARQAPPRQARHANPSQAAAQDGPRPARPRVAQEPRRGSGLVVSFKAKPRPVVRFIDFRIPVKKTKRAKRRR